MKVCLSSRLVAETIERLNSPRNERKLTRLVRSEILSRLVGSTASFFRLLDGSLEFARFAKHRFLVIKHRKNDQYTSVHKAKAKKSIKALVRHVKAAPIASIKGILSPKSLQTFKGLPLKEHFKHIYVLNLETDKGRRERVTKHLHEVAGLKTGDFELWRGTYGPDPKMLAKDLANLYGKTPDEMLDKAKTLHKRMDGNYEGGANDEDMHMKQIGCYLSHLRILTDASTKYEAAQQMIVEAETILKDPTALESEKTEASRKLDQGKKQLEEYSKVLILEDDNGFGLKRSSKFATLENVDKIFKKAMREVPEDWDMFYFMALSRKMDPKTGKRKHALADDVPGKETIKRMEFGLNLNAFAVSAKMYRPILEKLNLIAQDGTPGVRDLQPVDTMIGEIHDQHNCYVVRPAIAYQGGGSTINNRPEKVNIQQTRA